MMQPLKEALRWSSQAEDDLRFVEWLDRDFLDKIREKNEIADPSSPLPEVKW